MSCSPLERERLQRAPKLHTVKQAKLEESLCHDFLKTLPLEILLLLPTYGQSLWILNALLRLSKHYAALLASERRVMEALTTFKKAHLIRTYAMIRERLQAMNVLSLIDSVLGAYAAVVAGGYVLRTLCGESLEGTDIDVFVPYTMNQEMRAMEAALPMESQPFLHFHQEFVETCLRPALRCGTLLSSSAVLDIHYTSKDTIKNITRVETPCGMEVQFIFMEVDEGMSMTQVIERDFDFSFCKCVYNGRKVKTRHLVDQLRKVGTRRYMVPRWGRVRNALKKGYQKERELVREKKYKQRGFRFVDAKRAREGQHSMASRF